MSWVFLCIAGLLEIIWAFAMKESQGLTRLYPIAIMIIAMIGSFVFLALAMRTLPLGTSYMIWTGIGAIGTFILGICFLGEALTMQRAFAAFLIISGMLVMKLAH